MSIINLSVASGAPLDVRRFVVEERVSSLFTVSVWAFSEEPDLDLEGILGKDASLRIVHGSAHVADLGARVWRGMCTQAEQVHGVSIAGEKANSQYYLRIAPKAWLLTQRRGHRIYQHRSIPDVIDDLLGEWELHPAWKIARGSYPKLEYKVQYGESDYAFMSRLAEEAGICFTFPDEGGSNITFHDLLHEGPVREGPPIKYAEEPNRSSQMEFVTNVRLSHEVRPGLHTQRDYDFRRPSYELYGQSPRPAAPEDRYEQYHYQPHAMLVETGKADGGTPVADDKGAARHDDAYGKAKSERAILGRRMGRRQVAFETSVCDLTPGVLFHIGEHPHPDIAEGTKLLAIEQTLEGSSQDEWSMTGRAVFTDMAYRPPLRTEKPKMSNVQSAVVVGPPGQEIHVDELGRVRVQFPWDREGKLDDNSSCWIRVSQGWAGTGYGMFVIPRVGQEVLVGFLGGDPDAPIIVGRVFNATQIVPYKLPDHKTRSTWKSSSSPGGGGFNELMFEDLKHQELVWMQAEKDMRQLVKNDEIITIGHDRQAFIAGSAIETTSGDRTEVTSGKRTEISQKDSVCFVGGDSLRMVKGDQLEKIEGNMKVLVAKDQDIVIKQMKRERVGKDASLYVVGDRNERVDGTLSLTVGKNHHEKVSKNMALESGEQIHLKAGSALVIEAAQDLTLVGPGGFIRIDAGGITIRGTLVRINSGGLAGSGAPASPLEPEEATEAEVDEPSQPKPIDLRVDGIGQ